MYIYDLDISHIFCSGTIADDIANLANSFKYNLPKQYQFQELIRITDTSVRLSFLQEIDESLVEAITQITNDYGIASLVTLQNTAILAIDARTRELISKGAEYDGNIFSLSETAQRNWIAIRAAVDSYEAMGVFPAVTTYDDSEYQLTGRQHIVTFTTAMLLAVAKYYNSGRSLKLRVKQAATKAEVLAIKDRRN